MIITNLSQLFSVEAAVSAKTLKICWHNGGKWVADFDKLDSTVRVEQEQQQVEPL